MLYQGNLYGTTFNGGSGTTCAGGCGTVFMLDPTTGMETVLHSFTDGNDGAGPEGGLIVYKGYIYSTAHNGDVAGCSYDAGCGTIWRMKPDGTSFSTVHAFTGGSDGSNPDNGLLASQDGRLYGITERGANTGCLDAAGCGVAFRLRADGTLKVLHTFTGGRDGGNVLGELIEDQAGDILDAAAEGGYPKDCSHLLGCGTIFEVRE